MNEGDEKKKVEVNKTESHTQIDRVNASGAFGLAPDKG